ncbi:hypothetical protein PBI_YUNGJAMAL_14 [Mycobacterium phage YungJamal]|uniref:Uncharacterized protein n=1 Tax=Mycobacterium phage YungJamal TaxID=1505226 RepID=A0A076G9E5_BPMCO|nr:hypothetical protein PBI_YUNGJAMAL_14 [Mycobacterium phage YungJamal]
MTEAFFDTPTPQHDPLRGELLDMIRFRDYSTPRHRQVELGPSDVSHPCMRKTAFASMQEPETNPPFDPLASIIGTAMHTWLQSAAELANQVLGRQRWLTETRVPVTPTLAGSSDLYDTDTDTVIDWKTASTTRLRKYRKDPGPQYRGQVHLYARGFENLGFQVKRVAIAFIPRGATLHSFHVWSADYDPRVADAVLARRNQTLALIDDLQVEKYPDRYAWIPAESWDCEYCPFFSTNPNSPYQCKGDGT